MNFPEQTSILGLVSSFLGDDSPSSTKNAGKSGEPAIPNATACGGFEDEAAVQAPHVKVVIFSKDRPWQLQQLFRSMCLDGLESNHDAFSISLIVLARITEEYRTAYVDVHASVAKIVESIQNVTLTMHEENLADASSFQSLMEIIATEDENPTHWMFLTDDCILLVPLNILLQTATFALGHDIECFLSRLHPGITWTQTRDLPSPPPRAFLRYHPPERYQQGAGVYVYPCESGELDWAYPWDLSGGVYTNSVAQAVFEQLQGTNGLSHPNRMEVLGNQAITSLSQKHFLMTVPTYPMLLILAVNRVQEVCQAPLACVEAVAETFSPEALLSLYLSNRHLDFEQYRSLHFNSSHIGELFLCSEPEQTTPEVDTANGVKCSGHAPVLSVLIPVHAGPSQAAVHAMRSIVMQPVDKYQQEKRTRANASLVGDRLPWLSPLQIVIVDDRCTDGSIDAMLKEARKVADDYPFVSLTVEDTRRNALLNSEEAPNSTATTRPAHPSGVEVSIAIFASPRPGVAAALNHGLSCCKSDIVARMDADDIAAPGRLLGQVSALAGRPSVTAMGTSAVLFREEGDQLESNKFSGKANSTLVSVNVLPYASSGQDLTIRLLTSLPPTDAGFAAWSMLFSCAITHPSTVYRRKAAIELGGYDETYSCAEDYDLWLRMTSQDCSSLVSIPTIGLWHRKHRSRSGHVSQQVDEALRASIRSVQHLLKVSDSDLNIGSRLTPATKCLRKPKAANSLHELDEAAELLLAIEAAFLEHHKDRLTSREVSLVGKDCDARIGELATLAAERFATNASAVKDSTAWRAWCERCPHLTMNRIALLCHSYNRNSFS